MLRLAVIGAGNGGLAVAGYFGLRGHEVRLVDTDLAAVTPVQRTGSIEVTGKHAGRPGIALATTVFAEAISGADVIVVVVPANAHGKVAEDLAPHVTSRQIVVLHPGGAGGALEVAATFRRLKVVERPRIAEVESFMYGSKILGPAQVHISTVKLQGRLAALPARDTRDVLEALRGDYPEFVPARSVLQTSLNHMNAMLHVVGMTMNAGWIETSKGGFEFYRDGLSPTVARIVEEVDDERIAVSDALGADAVSLRTWIRETYHVEGPTLFETIQMLHATVYKTSKAPGTLGSRYLAEDVPTGLVPIAALGEAAGVQTPLTRLFIELASRIHQVDHWRTGRTLGRMGLEGRDAAGIRRAAEQGFESV